MFKVKIDGKVYGPFDGNRIKLLATKGKLKETDLICKKDSSKWYPASSVKGLEFSSSKALAVQEPPVYQTHPVVESDLISCAFCGEEIKATAKKCRHCGEILDPVLRAAQQQQQQPQQVVQAAAAPVIHVTTHTQNVNQNTNVVGGYIGRRWSRLVAMFLSLLIPGLGQWYKGQPINALVWFVLTVAGYFAFILPGFVLHFLCIVGAGVGRKYY